MAIARVGTPTSSADLTTTTSHVINVPAGVVDGNFLVLFTALTAGSATEPTITLTGWTKLDDLGFGSSSGVVAFTVWYRTASSEPASYTVTSSAAAKGPMIMSAYSGVDTSSPWGAAHGIVAAGSATTTHVTPSVTPRNTTDWVLSAFADRSTTSASKNTNWTATSPALERLEANNNSSGSSPWVNLAANDENAAVGSVSPTTHTDVSTISQANAGMWIGSLQQAASGTNWTKSLADTVTLSDALAKTIHGGKSDSITLSDALVKTVGKSAADTATLSEALAKAIGKSIADTTTLSEALVKAFGKSLADTNTLSDVLTPTSGGGATNWTQNLADTISLSDAISKAIGASRSDTTTLSDAVGKAIGLAKADTITPADAVSKTVGVHKADTTSLIDSIHLPGVVAAVRQIHRFFIDRFGPY